MFKNHEFNLKKINLLQMQTGFLSLRTIKQTRSSNYYAQPLKNYTSTASSISLTPPFFFLTSAYRNEEY